MDLQGDSVLEAAMADAATAGYDVSQRAVGQDFADDDVGDGAELNVAQPF